MKYEVELGGRFQVDVNYWSGKSKICYEGMELPADGKNTFLLGNEKCAVRGSLFSGVYLCRGTEKALLCKLTWGDYIAGIIPFIVSLIGGYIGAIIGAVSFFVCYKIMPYVRHYPLRLLICIGIAGTVFLLILLLATIFPSAFFD